MGLPPRWQYPVRQGPCRPAGRQGHPPVVPQQPGVPESRIGSGRCGGGPAIRPHQPGAWQAGRVAAGENVSTVSAVRRPSTATPSARAHDARTRRVDCGPDHKGRHLGHLAEDPGSPGLLLGPEPGVVGPSPGDHDVPPGRVPGRGGCCRCGSDRGSCDRNCRRAATTPSTFRVVRRMTGLRGRAAGHYARVPVERPEPPAHAGHPRRWTGIEPACPRSSGTSVLKTGGATRHPHTSAPNVRGSRRAAVLRGGVTIRYRIPGVGLSSRNPTPSVRYPIVAVHLGCRT